ncbi:hypothetical protein V7138_13210 [Bacillus sp. JJ1533]|uniref:hypothetical protein n=1 Tax=Bacillus sp. JJ1533 TaxID=3122959 RepID=UPI002FFDFD48
MEIKNRIANMLTKHYGIQATLIEQRPGGWSALAFFVENLSEKYFLKVYDKRKLSVASWINAIDRYNPLVKWLHGHTDLKNNLINPILTKSKSFSCEDEQFV